MMGGKASLERFHPLVVAKHVQVLFERGARLAQHHQADGSHVIADMGVQLDPFADVEGRRVSVGVVGVAVLGRPLQVVDAELPPVDGRVVTGGEPVAVEA